MSTVDRAAEVLTEHFELASIPDEGSECECGDHIAGPEEYPVDSWREHQAEALAAAGLLATPDHDASVWDEGWNAYDGAYRNFDRWPDPDDYPNPYRKEQS